MRISQIIKILHSIIFFKINFISSVWLIMIKNLIINLNNGNSFEHILLNNKKKYKSKNIHIKKHITTITFTRF